MKKAGLLTDSKPIIEVIPRDDTLTDAAAMLTKTIRGVWDERNMMDQLTRVLYISQIFGACPGHLWWNKELNLSGDIDFQAWDTRHFLLDPLVVSPDRMQGAEYLVFEELWPLSRVWDEFGALGRQVAVDKSYAEYSTYALHEQPSGLISAVGSMLRRPFRKQSDSMRAAAIPRVVMQDFWIRDRTRMRDLDPDLALKFLTYLADMRKQYPLLRERYKEREKNDYVFTGAIRHVMRGGREILLDEGNPYWHGEYPADLMSWGLEIEDPWGRSEVEELRKLQDVINKLGGVITENAIKVSNPVWIGDFNALTEKQWAQLDDRPNLQIRMRPGSQLKRESAPALPGSTFATLTFLVNAFDQLSGLVDVTQGRKPSGNLSGVALEGLQLAAQVMIRLQARQVETFIQRFGQKMISMIFQFYPTKRMLTMFGPDGRLINFEYARDQLLAKLGERQWEDAWRFFNFRIHPGSSLAMTKVQEFIKMSNLYNMGLVPGKDVLIAGQIANPEYLIEEARKERVLNQGPVPVPIRQGAGGQRQPASFPAGRS